MCWDAISAVGTILAAIVGVAGIWLNVWEKTRKLKVDFEIVPSFKIYLSNNSLRSTVITKMMCSVNSHIFYIEYFDGLNELVLPPATTQSIDIVRQNIYDAYCEAKLSAICAPNDKVTISLCDNYGRKYRIKTDMGISAFENKQEWFTII